MTRIAPRVTDVRLVPAARIWRYDQTMIVLVEDIFYIWSLHFSSFFIFRLRRTIGGERPARNDQRAASPRPRGQARSGTSDAERDLVSDGRDAATIMLSAHASIPYVSGTGRGRVEAAGAGRFGAPWAPAAERCGRPRAPLSAHRGRTLKPLRLHRPQMSAEPPLPRPASQRRGLRVVLSTHVSRIAPHLLSACY